jgi:hypothetical protein
MALSHVMNVISNAGIVGAGTGSGGGGGGGSNLDSQTVTVGTHTQSFAGGSGLPASTGHWRGKFTNSYATAGSISDGTSNLYSGASIVELYYTWNTVYGVSYLALRIDGGSLANSGWTTLTVGTTAFQRTAATYNGSSSGDTQWTWTTSGDLTGAQNPFAASGQTTTCVFT